MSVIGISREKASLAKREISKNFLGKLGITGVGVKCDKTTNSHFVNVYCESKVDVAALRLSNQFPAEFDGVPVRLSVVAARINEQSKPSF